jgi:hypothetical protein
MEKTLPPVSEVRFRGMCANLDAHLHVGEVLLAENYVLVDGKLVPRSGTTAIGSALGSVLQAVIQWEDMGGVQRTTAFASGTMQHYNWTTGAWGAAITLATEGITASATEPYCVAVSRGRLIVTDGVNRPWMWDPVTDTYTTLTEAPISRRVRIHYDKPVFTQIVGAPLDFEWGDEGDPPNGYGADDQGWTFVQSDGSPMVETAPLNNKLVVIKQDSINSVYGEIEENFQTNANREGVSDSEGGISGASVVIFDDDVYLLSRNGPRRIVDGERLENINEGIDASKQVVDRLADIWGDVDRENWHNSIGAAYPDQRQIWWAIPTYAYAGLRRRILVYHIDDDAWSTLTVSHDVQAMCEAAYEEGSSSEGTRVMLLGVRDVSVSPQGFVLIYNPRVSLASDWYAAGAGNVTNFTKTIRSRLYGQSTPNVKKRLAEVRLTLDVDETTTAFTYHHTLQRAGAPLANSSLVAGERSFVIPDVPGEYQYRRGFNKTAKAVGWQIAHSTLDIGPTLKSALTILTVAGSEAST